MFIWVVAALRGKGRGGRVRAVDYRLSWKGGGGEGESREQRYSGMGAVRFFCDESLGRALHLSGMF